MLIYQLVIHLLTFMKLLVLAQPVLLLFVNIWHNSLKHLSAIMDHVEFFFALDYYKVSFWDRPPVVF